MTRNTDFKQVALKLIKMEAIHIDRVHELETLCFSDPWSRASFEAELTNPLATYLLLTDGEAIWGYCGMWLVVDEGHITNLGIDPSVQGKGLGKTMMGLIMDWARQHKICRLTLEVRVSNTRAIKLYEQLGFKSAGIRPAYYEDNGEDACIMWIEL